MSVFCWKIHFLQHRFSEELNNYSGVMLNVSMIRISLIIIYVLGIIGIFT